MNEKSTPQEIDPSQFQWLSTLRSRLDKKTFVFQIVDRFFEGGQLRSDVVTTPSDNQTSQEFTLDERRFVIQRNGTFVNVLWGNIKESISDDTVKSNMRRVLSNVFVPERKVESVLEAVAPVEKASYFAEVDLPSAGIKKTLVQTHRSSEIKFKQASQTQPDQVAERLLYREEQRQSHSFKEYFISVGDTLTNDKVLSFLVGEKRYVFKGLARYDVESQKLKAVHLRIKVNGKEFRVVYSPDNQIPGLGWEGAASEYNEEDLAQLDDFLKPDLLTFQHGEAVLELDLRSLHPAMPALIKLWFPSQGGALLRQYGMLDPVIPEFAYLQAAKS